MSDKMKGQVKLVQRSKGFGFILQLMAAKMFSFTSTAIQGAGFKTTGEGQQVEFTIENGAKQGWLQLT